MKLRSYRIKSFVMKSGERYCLLVDKVSGLPLYYPNLFVTTQVRNKSLSVAVMEQALAAINVLLTFCDERKIDLEARFLKREFFELHELDALRDHCQLHFARERVGSSGNVIPLSPKGRPKRRKSTGLANEYMRLTHIGKYVKWLADTLLSSAKDQQTTRAIKAMQEGLESRRPANKGRNQEGHEKGLTKEQVAVLLEVIRPGAEVNPFENLAIQVRNQLMIWVLLHLGIRGGELLNLRIKDIDWSNNQIVIARRADEKSDPRVDQPLVKTLDRRLPMKDTLANAIHQYVTNHRKKVPGARKNDYLFVTHKSGPTQGQPISSSAYRQVINLIAGASPELAYMHGHDLRHTWNHDFSEVMDQKQRQGETSPEQQKEQEEMRSYLQGWKKGSKTSAIYNKRFIEAKAMEAGLALQEGISRIPENLKK